MNSTLSGHELKICDFLVSLPYYYSMTSTTLTPTPDSVDHWPPTPNATASTEWRERHMGRLLGLALRRFDERVLEIMAHDPHVPLALSHLAAREQVSAAHIHITRHLEVQGSRLTDLAIHAGISKQAMGELVQQCEAWGLVNRQPDPHDRRARLIVFTQSGLDWLDAFRRAVLRAESEMRQELDDAITTVLTLGLEAYGSQAPWIQAQRKRQRASMV